MNTMEKVCRRLLQAVDYFNSRVGLASSILLVILTLIIAYEAAMRYLLNSPTTWVFEVSQLLLMLMVMLSLGHVLQKEKHVKMDALIYLMSKKAWRWIDGLTSILGSVVCLLIAHQGLLMALSSFHTHQQLQDTGIPLWPIKLTVFLGFFLLALQFIVRGVKLGFSPHGAGQNEP